MEILEKLTNKDDLFEFSGQVLCKELLEKILEKMNISVQYNEITKDVDIIGLPKEYSAENAETILPIFLKELLKKYKIKGTKKEIEDLLTLIFDSHRYNPIIEMLTNNEWDHIDRFEILYEIMGVTDEFNKLLIRKWFHQTIIIVFNSNDNLFGIDGVLTLQGEQGVRKNNIYQKYSIKPKMV